ncbi:MAG: hypothetical protein DRP02_02320 [Candidatus Gerdarchaeota archaeon]|nr:MAG: hypothetical protein DRP02_02320 [Candidatus Gerdarchaeota archaeon]
MKEILLPHPEKKSREVTEKDLKVVLSDMKELHRLCSVPIGGYRGGEAIAHVQIEGKDPLRFYVTKRGKVIINPKIAGTKQPYMHKEGCMSFPTKPPKEVSRHNMVEVDFIEASIEDEKIDLEDIKTRNFSGMEAAVVQHEIDHFNLNLLY